MTRDYGNRTYRVRQLPRHVSEEDLPSFLARCCGELGGETNIVVWSLATSLLPFENPRTKTATVTFNSLPLVFNNDETEWTLPTPGSHPNVIVDVHFLGFTALNDAETGIHSLDCIAISGLASHPFGSWAERSRDSYFMWLRDRLPRDFRQVRSIIYGYDSRLLRSQSFQGIEDLALSLLAHLKAIGRGLKSAKPVVFLAHSLGGIVLKNALLEMANSGDSGEFMLSLVQEVIFFGVPNRGMETSHWLPMVHGQPNKTMVQLLSRDSHFLADLDVRFSGISAIRNVRLVSFFETERSKTAEVNSSTGKWEMCGPFKVLVEKESAVQCNSHRSDVLPINKSHSEMVKFREGSEDYSILARYIFELIEDIALGSQNSGKLKSRQQKPNTTSWSSLDDPPTSDAEKEAYLQVLILSSLDIPLTQYRFHKVEKSYGPTFKWIWEDSNATFRSWLKNDNHIYWIGGKPGSGKSTIMKYIFNNYQRLGLQTDIYSPRNHIRVGFFFHDRGSHLQKSFEGLLYTVLHQILVQERRLIRVISHIFTRVRAIKSKGARQEWPIEALSEALDCIIKQNSIPIDLYLFLDALDEYGGSPSEVVSFIKNLASSSGKFMTRIKICFSSRIWNVFVDEFHGCPGFKIHEKTLPDILAYINGNFGGNRSITRLEADKSERKKMEQLKTALVAKAEGVFLWVKLVVHELLEACTEGATVAELLEGLASFPGELEALYIHIVKRIPGKFRLEAYAMMEIVLRSDFPMVEYDFWLAVLCSSCQTIDDCSARIRVPKNSLPNKSDEDNENNSKEHALTSLVGSKDQRQRRIKSRCGGLIEISEVRRLDEFITVSVQFMHQTVKDFVSKPGFRMLITEEDNKSAENGYSYLAKYGITQLDSERQSLKKTDLTYIVKDGITQLNTKKTLTKTDLLDLFSIPTWFSYLRYASRSESTTGLSQKHLIDSSSHAFHPKSHPQEVYGLFDSAMTFAIVMNLQIYVDMVLSTNLAKFERNMGHGQTNVCTYLHTLVRAIVKQDIYTPSTKSSIGAEQELDDLSDMANLLLEHKANPKALYLGKTPFQMLFSEYYEGYCGEPKFIDQKVVNLAETFLKHGQDVNVTIRGKNFTRERSMKFKTLHIADTRLARVLLDYGADVNALDQNGETPLDIAFGDSGNLWEKSQESGIPAEGYRLILLLLNDGGCITKMRKRYHGIFLKNFSQAYPLHSIDPRIKDPPVLGLPEVPRPSRTASERSSPLTPSPSRNLSATRTTMQDRNLSVEIHDVSSTPSLDITLQPSISSDTPMHLSAELLDERVNSLSPRLERRFRDSLPRFFKRTR